MIYLDTSVALAHLLAEDRTPPDALWRESLVSSRLLACELWVRLHASRTDDAVASAARALLSRLAFVELVPPVLERACEPFPKPVRTLDALHLATVEVLRARGEDVALASYDARMLAAARGLGIRIHRL